MIGGGLGLRLGEPYVEKIREAMMPHLFADHRPPEMLLASLGDLGGAIGATLLASARKRPRPPDQPRERRQNVPRATRAAERAVMSRRT